MFNSIVAAPAPFSFEKLKSGAGLSIVVHACVLGAALLIQHLAAQSTVALPEPVIVFKAARRAKGNPTPTTATAATPAVQKNKKHRLTPSTEIKPTELKPLPAEPPPQVAAALSESSTQLPFIEGADPNGVEEGGVAQAPLGGSGQGGGGEEVVPFGQGMTLPRLISAPQIQYTREAREAHVTGTFIARCTITREGDVRDCRTIMPVPLMSDVVLAALLSRKYVPVSFQGQPVSVTYVFNVKLQLQ